VPRIPLDFGVKDCTERALLVCRKRKGGDDKKREGERARTEEEFIST